MRTEQQELEKACHRVDGYFFPSPSKPGGNRREFERAKEELLTNLRADLAWAESLEFDQFAAFKGIEE